MKLPFYQVDAFASEVFKGNPAGICPLQSWPEDELLQKIAEENNLSETAFFVENDGSYHLRWFTPTREVDLCGHATLATAFVLKNILNRNGNEFIFSSISGELRVSTDSDLFYLNFPSRPPQVVELNEDFALKAGLQGATKELRARERYFVFSSEEEVARLSPDQSILLAADEFGFVATAPASGTTDFVSRAFFPSLGIAEDPVTGSTHCSLVPYWAAQLGKNTLAAKQISARGGELACELAGERVLIGGRAALYLSGEISI